jgi:hypothetical protein
MSSSKKGLCDRRLSEFIRVDCQSVMLVFSTQLLNCCALSPSLWFNSHPSPLLFVNSLLYTRIQCVRGGGVIGPQSLYRSIF